MTTTQPDQVTIEFTGGGLYEHVAHHPDGRSRVARGSFFECVGRDGYLTFDERMARQYHAEKFDAEALQD